MEIVALFVASKNLKVTDGTSITPQGWVSKEDQELFKRTKEEFPVYIMGSKTYDEIANHIVPSSEHKRIVLTSSTDKYSDREIPGALEFTSLSPEDLVDRLDLEGYEEVLLLGGPAILLSFLTAHLVSELRLTIEPVTLDQGLDLFPRDTTLNQEFTLESSKALNKKGTIHNVYTARI